MVIKIQNNVPLPRSMGDYPFKKMKKGDSFAVEIVKKQSVRTCIQNFQKKHPRMKFVTHTDGDKIRVWRIK